MEIKLLYINFLLVLLTFAYANEEVSHFRGKQIDGNPVKFAILHMQSNKADLREEFAKIKKDCAKVVVHLKEQDKYHLQFEMINELITNIIGNIEEYILILSDVNSSPSDEPISTSEKVIKTLLSILHETILFGDIIYNFPDITKHILKFEEKRVNILTWSLIYADSMQELLDDFTADIISGAQARLHKIKSEFKLRKSKFIQ
ncbi:PREDICTED: uncharacterized protein LOC106785695 [Polistes canadensis]|uniref:uncharacterized protein LOC106785695 n=1 Tax=Polistes canadensis TaxID=91411 RepID=UPI0007190713|nr:PREDICTED: uncharacterized protein LOC106785695 [Polistes canadensis]